MTDARNAPVKILFVIDYFRDPWAGTEGQFFQLIKGLDRQQFEPHMLVLEASPWLENNDFPCTWTALGQRSLANPMTWFRLWQQARRFRREGFRLAHIFFNDASILCPPVFRLTGVHSLISRRDMGYWYTPTLKRILRVTRRFCVGAVVNSEAVKRVTMEAEGFTDSQVSVIYNGYPETDTAHASTDSTPAPEPLASLQAQQAVIAVLVANIRPIKRMPDAIRAISQLRQRHPDINLHLVIIGAGDPTPLEALADIEKVGEQVHFTGARSDVRQCLEHADIGLLCSESEGFSNAVVEYLQAGLPAVCSAVGGNPEAIQPGVNGALYPMGDVPALVTALEPLVTDADYRRRLGSNARDGARQAYALSRMVAAHESLYKTTVPNAQVLAGSYS